MATLMTIDFADPYLSDAGALSDTVLLKLVRPGCTAYARAFGESPARSGGCVKIKFNASQAEQGELSSRTSLFLSASTPATPVKRNSKR